MGQTRRRGVQADIAMKQLLIACLALAAAPALAQSGGSDVAGRWGGANGGGPNYRAAVQMTGSGLHLRFYQGDTPDLTDADLLFDNPAIVDPPAGTTAVSLIPQPDGTLEIDVESHDTVATFDETLYLAYTGDQVSVVRYVQQDQPADGTQAQVICDVDLQSGQAIWADDQTSVTPPPAQALNAAGWTSTTASDLGVCPSPD